MSQKASSLPRQSPLRRFINSIRERSKEASPAPTASGAQPTTSDTVHSSSDLTERLWNRAYDKLKANEDKWVDAYERILSRELRGDDSSYTTLELQENEIEQK